MRIDWSQIDTVLLDMDGTLIDKYHDDFFWTDVVPKAYAAKNKLSLADAKKICYAEFKKKRGLVDWSSIDGWEKTLGLKLWHMRQRSISFMRLHPHTLRFLKFLKKRGKIMYLITAASHRDTDMKLNATKIGGYFDGIYSQHDIGKPKVDVSFWKKLHEKIKFDRNRTLFADDSESVIRAAKKFGIKYIVLKRKYNSRRPPSRSVNVICVNHFDELIKFKKKTDKSIVIKK